VLVRAGPQAVALRPGEAIPEGAIPVAIRVEVPREQVVHPARVVGKSVRAPRLKFRSPR